VSCSCWLGALTSAGQFISLSFSQSVSVSVSVSVCERRCFVVVFVGGHVVALLGGGSAWTGFRSWRRRDGRALYMLVALSMRGSGDAVSMVC
jgi:hypothetical protein